MQSVRHMCSFMGRHNKDITVLSNCHTDKITEVKREIKDCIRREIPCPKIIEFYNKYIGGVDLSDRLVGLDMDKKINK